MPNWLCILFILLPALLPLVNGQCLNTNPNCVYWTSHSTYPAVCDQTVIDAAAGCLSCYGTNFAELDAILTNCSLIGYNSLTIPVVSALPSSTVLFPTTTRSAHSHSLPSSYSGSASISVQPTFSVGANSTTQVAAPAPTKTSSNNSYTVVAVLVGAAAGVALMSFLYVRRRRRRARRDTDGMNGVSLLLQDREQSEIPRVYTGYDGRYKDQQNSFASSTEYLSAPKNAYVHNISGPAVAPIPFLGAAPTIPMPITNIPPSPLITPNAKAVHPQKERNNGLGPMLLTGGRTSPLASPVEERNDMFRGPSNGSYTNLPYSNTRSYQ